MDFTFSGESGPTAGYLTGQSQHLVIRVGLPPNSVDMANPIAGGAVPWNGKNRDLGGGGYAGAVGSVTSSTNLGYVGTSTDTGHSGGSGSFALNPDGTLNVGLIEDFASDGIHEQHVWGVTLARAYYGTDPIRKYWMGCSTGGRQGHLPTQRSPHAMLRTQSPATVSFKIRVRALTARSHSSARHTGGPRPIRTASIPGKFQR